MCSTSPVCPFMVRKPVFGVDGTAKKFFLAAFGMERPNRAMRFGKISIGWLQKTFSNMKITPSHADWLHYLRAYLLYIIGSYIIPDSSHAYVSAFYLPLLHDVSAVGSYAWGEAALANFHDSMRSTSCNFGDYHMHWWYSLLSIYKYWSTFI